MLYLYDKKNNSIDVYDLNPCDKKLYDYRLEQMRQIPETEMVMRGVTGIGIENYEIFKLYEHKLDTETIPIENANGEYHKLETDFSYGRGTNKEVMLNSYYLGLLQNRKIAKIQDAQKLRYFLLTKTQYRYYIDKKFLDQIIEIPESLYLLSLIEQEKFSFIGDKDISEQLALFNVEKKKEIDLNTIIRMENIGIEPACYLKTIKKAENDAHILKLIKR